MSDAKKTGSMGETSVTATAANSSNKAFLIVVAAIVVVAVIALAVFLLTRGGTPAISENLTQDESEVIVKDFLEQLGGDESYEVTSESEYATVVFQYDANNKIYFIQNLAPDGAFEAYYTENEYFVQIEGEWIKFSTEEGDGLGMGNLTNMIDQVFDTANLNVAFQETVDCEESASGKCYVITISEDSDDTILYFDAATKRLVKSSSKMDDGEYMDVMIKFDNSIQVSVPQEVQDAALDFSTYMQQYTEQMNSGNL